MDIGNALTTAAKKAGWSPVKIAAATDVAENTARRWLAGDTVPSGDKLMTLRREMPGFADLLDGKAAFA